MLRTRWWRWMEVKRNWSTDSNFRKRSARRSTKSTATGIWITVPNWFHSEIHRSEIVAFAKRLRLFLYLDYFIVATPARSKSVRVSEIGWISEQDWWVANGIPSLRRQITLCSGIRTPYNFSARNSREIPAQHVLDFIHFQTKRFEKGVGIWQHYVPIGRNGHDCRRDAQFGLGRLTACWTGIMGSVMTPPEHPESSIRGAFDPQLPTITSTWSSQFIVSR